MRSHSITVIATLLVSVLFAVPALAAGAARTFVSGAGNDSNNCTNVATPCRHLAAAYAATAPNGEIYVLDPANYGSLTITGPVSIEGHGWASIAPVSGNSAITINANLGDTINIIGVVIDGTGFANTTGITFTSGGFLTIQGCVIRNLTGSGIAFAPGGSSAATLDVLNTLVANNGGHGIYVQPTGSGAAAATFTGVQTINNANDGIGIYGNLSTFPASPGIQAIVADSTIAGNGVGLHAFSASGHPPTGMTVNHTAVGSGNAVGLKTESANAQLLIGRSTIAGNNFAWDTNGGTLQSYGDNYFTGNVFNNHGPTPTLSPQ